MTKAERIKENKATQEVLAKIHAVRVNIQNATRGMSPEEKTAWRRADLARKLKNLGIGNRGQVLGNSDQD